MRLPFGPRIARTKPENSNSSWIKHVPDDELDVLMGLTDLSKLGPLPSDTALLSQEIRTRAEMNMERAKTTLALPSPDNVTVPPGMSFTDWLKFRWQSADASVRHTLRTVADSLGIEVPLTRTRRVGGKDSSGSQRTDSDQQPSQGERRRKESPLEAEEPKEAGYHDPPQWHDEVADGWEPCDSLYEALHPDDRGWY